MALSPAAALRVCWRAGVLVFCLALFGGEGAGAAETESPGPAKKEFSDAEFDADSTACRVEAQIKVLGPEGDGKREITVAQAVERDGVYKVTRDLIADCMKKKGY